MVKQYKLNLGCVTFHINKCLYLSMPCQRSSHCKIINLSVFFSIPDFFFFLTGKSRSGIPEVMRSDKVCVITLDARGGMQNFWSAGFNLFCFWSFLFIWVFFFKFTTGSPFWATVTFGYGMQPNLMLVSTPVWQETSLAWQAAQEPSQLKVFPLLHFELLFFCGPVSRGTWPIKYWTPF